MCRYVRGSRVAARVGGRRAGARRVLQGQDHPLLVGFGPGGEDDLWARTISRHIGNHIPGNPIMVPVHAPGSGGLLVVNRLYNAAPKDGTVVGMINRGIPFEPLLGGQGTQFDALKFNYLGSPGRDTTVCAARKDAAVQTLQDLYSKELTRRRHRLGRRHRDLSGIPCPRCSA